MQYKIDQTSFGIVKPDWNASWNSPQVSLEIFLSLVQSHVEKVTSTIWVNQVVTMATSQKKKYHSMYFCIFFFQFKYGPLPFRSESWNQEDQKALG